MFFPLLLLLLSAPEGPTVRITLQSDIATDFTDWSLKLDTGQTALFSSEGTARLQRPADSRAFEVLDAARRVRFAASWQRFAGRDAIDIPISEQAVHLTQVVTAGRTAQDPFRVPAEIAVLLPSAMPEREFSQTSDVLKEQAELLLQKTNLGGGSPIMRGMSGNRILLMVDGFRVNNATFRLGLNQYLNTVPGDQLQQIEVMSGPTGVQYGSDGLGGTIHLRSTDPASHEGREVSYHGMYATSDGTHTHRVGARTRVGTVSLQGHFRANTYEDLEAADPVGTQVPTGYDALDGGLNLTWAPDEATRLRFINTVSQARHVPRTDRVQSGRDLLWEYHPQDFILHGVRLETSRAVAAYDYADMGVAFMRQKEGNPRISSGSPTIMTETRAAVDTLQANAAFTKAGGGFELVYGFDAATDSVASSGREIDLETGAVTPEAGKFPGDATYESVGLFVMAERDLGRGWGLKGGLRQSFISLQGTLVEPIGKVDETYDHLTPSLSVGYAQARFYVALSAAQGFRAPNLEDALSLGPTNRGFDAPNPDLAPEDVWNYELNLRLYLGAGQLQAGFYTARYESLFERVPGTWLGSDTYEGEPVFILDNVGRARVDGVSVGFEHPFGDHHRLVTDAAWVYGTQTDADVPMTRIPPLRGNLQWHYLSGDWRVVGTFTWADRQDRLSPGDLDDSRIPTDGTPGYGALHLRTRYSFTDNLAVNLGLENLTDKLYKTHGSGIYEPGRRALLSLDARWR